MMERSRERDRAGAELLAEVSRGGEEASPPGEGGTPGVGDACRKVQVWGLHCVASSLKRRTQRDRACEHLSLPTPNTAGTVLAAHP